MSALLADTQALSWAKEPRRLVVCHLVTVTPIRKLFPRQERNSGQTIGRDTSNTEPTANLADKSDNFEPESGQGICQAWLLLVVGQEILLIIRPDKCQRCSSERDKIAVLLVYLKFHCDIWIMAQIKLEFHSVKPSIFAWADSVMRVARPPAATAMFPLANPQLAHQLHAKWSVDKKMNRLFKMSHWWTVHTGCKIPKDTQPWILQWKTNPCSPCLFRHGCLQSTGMKVNF